MSQTNAAIIKLATPASAAAISVLGRTTFVQTFGHYFRDSKDLEKYLEKTFAEEKIRRSLQNPKNFYWLALINEKPVGYAKLKLDSPSQFIHSGQVGQLQKIYVQQEYLSKGIGLELQNNLVSKATICGIQSLWLSVLESNERAINFYRKTGFSSIGYHDFTIGKECFEFIAMCRALGS